MKNKTYLVKNVNRKFYPKCLGKLEITLILALDLHGVPVITDSFTSTRLQRTYLIKI